MKIKTQLIFTMLLFAQISFSQNNQIIEVPNDTLEIEEDTEKIENEFDKKNVEMKETNLTKEELIKQVQLAINPKFKNWILFKNGTFVIIEDISEEEIETAGIEKMKEFGPVYVGSEAADFRTITLTNVEGWLVSGHGYGMYTYVHPTELEKENPDSHEIGLFGRSKRNLDGLNPEIICLSSEGKVIIK